MASLDVAPHDADEGGRGPELPTLFQQYIHMTHYSRWRDDLGRREYWYETVSRYVDWIRLRSSKSGYEMTEDESLFIYESIAKTESMCSMRAFMTAGEAAERDNVAAYNCAYLAIDDPRAFDESMYLLMCGTGVGFSVERQSICKLPEVPDRLFPCEDVIVVKDNRKSWASSYRRLLAMLWAGHIPTWDVSDLRPAGARLKTFGGRASGPAPLVDLFRYTIDVFKGAIGRRLNSLECHGIMCKIGDIVVSGGVRRSALISLSNPSDDRMRDAKSGDWRAINPHYQLANNSAVWTEKPDIGRFMAEWVALYESKSGERGIINREALRRQVIATGRRDPGPDFGGNPCFIGETLVDTAEGRIRIDELATRYASGQALPMTFAFDTDEALPVLRQIRKAWVTKMATELVEVETDKGVVVRCTPEHRFLVRDGGRSSEGHYVEAKDLVVGQRLRKIARWVNDQRQDRRYLNHRETEEVSNGTVCQSRFMWEQAYGPIPDGMEVHHINEDATDDRLSNFELIDLHTHQSFHSTGERNGRYIDSEDEALVEVYERAMAYSRSGRLTYYCWRRGVEELGYVGRVARGNALKIRGMDWDQFEAWLKERQPLVNDTVASVTWIVLDEAVPVYDLSVDGTHNFAVATDGVEHTIVVHNCMEIILRSCELCNLTEIVARVDDSLEDLKRKAVAATIMGTIQSTCTDFDYVRPIWKKNCEEERLLGVSITGELDHPVLARQDEESARWKQELKQVCIDVNVEWAEKLSVNQSVAITCQKPSGTVSSLVDSSAGGHARYAKHYVRRTRVHQLDPIADVVCGSGVPCEQDAYKAENTVLEWPIKAPEGAITTADMTALDQLERWLHTRTHFTEHNPSATISVHEHEWLDVGAWVYKHFDEIGGLSFLPADVGGHGYTQLPYEEITEAEYERRVAAMPKEINWSSLSMIEHDDQTKNARELACQGGACDIISI